MSSKHLFLFIFLFLCLNLPSIYMEETPSQTVLPLGESLYGQIKISDPSMTRNMTQYFTLTIDQSIPEEDLMIMVKPGTIKADPDLFISSKFNYPNAYENSELVCNSFGLDVCTIPAKNITNGSIFYLGVNCYTDCDFYISAQYNTELILTLGQEAYVKFYETASEIARFYIPLNESLNQLIIYANLLNNQEVNETFHLYVNEGNVIPTSSSYDFISDDIWFDGKGVSVLKDWDENKSIGKKLMTGVNYTILIEAGKNSLIQLIAEVYPKIRTMFLFQQLHDIVNYQTNQTYLLEISDKDLNLMKNDPLIIELRVFSGDPDFYVHYDTLPTVFNDYKWFSTEEGSEALTISKKEREAVNSTDNKFYITVFGKYDSAYILTAYYTSRNNDYLLFGETMSGTILNDELVNFRLNLYGSGSANITLDLISETGNADLVIKQCNSLEKHKCRITKDDVLSKNSVAQNSTYFFLYSDNYGGKDSIRFLFNEADCHIEIEDYDYGKINICTYQIGVYGNSNSTLSSHYSLIAKHSNIHTILIEGVPIRSSLEINEYEFYKFNVQNDTNIDSVSFVVTNIGGDVTVFSSRKIKFPNSTTYDMASFFEMDPCTYKKNSSLNGLIGSYYIAVKAVTQADYIITAVLHHQSINNGSDLKNSSVQIKYTKLLEGEPLKFSFSDPNSRYYFRIRNNFNNTNELQSLFVNIRVFSGKFKGYLTNDGTDPSETNYQLLMIDNEFVLNKTEKVKNYKILIVADQSQVSSKYKFSVSYTTSQSIISLGYESIYDYLEENEERFYKVSYSSEDENIAITSTIYTSNTSSIDIYISLEENIIYPSENLFTYYLGSDVKNGTVNINREAIRKYCPQKRGQPQMCRIYIGVEAQETLFYSLVVSQKLTPILLYDDVNAEVPPPINNDYQKFYYFVPSNATVTIFVDSLYMNLNAFLNIKALSTMNKSEWVYPNSTNYEYSYNTSYYLPGSIILKQKYFHEHNCESVLYGCVVLLSVAKQANQNDDLSTNINIVVSSHVTRLQEGKSFVSNVDRHTYKYFSIFVNKEDCVLIISVTPIGDGDPDLVVAKGKDERPTLEKYDWISTSYKGEQLQIIRNSSNKTEKTMTGMYTIGVYGFSNCTFSITVAFSSHKIIYLKPGFPNEIYLKANETIYFEYYHFEGSFRVILSKEIGEAKVYINPLNRTLDFLEQLPSAESSIWNTKSSNKDIAYIKESDQYYCTYCSYVIGVHSKQESKINLIVASYNQPIHLQGGKLLNDYVKANESIHYFYQTVEESALLDFAVYAGDLEVYISNTETVSTTEYLHKFTKSNLTANKFSLRLGKGYSLVPFENDSPVDKKNYSDVYRYSILIKGNKNSNYSLSVTSQSQIKILRFGVSDSSVLKIFENHSYLFFSIDETTVNLLISVINLGKNGEITFPKITLNRENDSGDIENAIIAKNITNLNTIFLEIKTQPGIYYINVTNEKETDINYNILVNSDEINLILPGAQNMMISPLGQTDKYELYSPGKRKLFIEIFECFGQVQLKGTQNFNNMKDNKYDWEFEYPYVNNHIIAFYEVNEGPVFIGVESVQGYQPLIENSTSLDEAFYVMKTHLLPPKGKIPQESFFAGDGGTFEWRNSYLNDEVIVTYSTVSCGNNCKDQSRYKPIQYIYYLHISADPYLLNSFSKCNMNNDVFALFQISKEKSNKIFYDRYIQLYNADEQPKVAKFNIALPKNLDGPFFVNIVSEVFVVDAEENIYEQFTILYNSMELYKNMGATNSYSKYIIIFSVVGSVIVLISIGCCCYYCRRTKKFEKRLKYELSDVRNVANSGELFENQKADKNDQIPLPYKGFLEEKQEGGA